MGGILQGKGSRSEKVSEEEFIPKITGSQSLIYAEKSRA